MANRFWVGGSGNWSDGTNHWSTTTGGAPGASVPGSADVAIVDANSGTPTITLNQNVTLSSSGYSCRASHTLVATGYTLSVGILTIINGATLDLGGDLTMDSTTRISAASPTGGTFRTNGYTLSFGRFIASQPLAVEFGSSVVTFGSGAGDPIPASNCTVNAGTSTIHITGSFGSNLGLGYGAGLTLNKVVLNNTYNLYSLNLNDITIADFEIAVAPTSIFCGPGVVTFGAIRGVGTSGNLITIAGSGGSGGQVVLSAGAYDGDYLYLNDCAVSPNDVWFAGTNSTNVGGNTGWNFSTRQLPGLFFLQDW